MISFLDEICKEYEKAILAIASPIKEAIDKTEIDLGKKFSKKERELYGLLAVLYSLLK